MEIQQTVFKIIEVVGMSNTSIEDAITAAIQKASKTLHSLGWFEVIQTRGRIENNKVAQYQVIVKIGFHID